MARIPLIPKVIQVTLSYLFTALGCLACAMMMQVIFELNTSGLKWTTATVFVGAALLAVALYKARLRQAPDVGSRVFPAWMRYENESKGLVKHKRTLSFKWVAFAASLFVVFALAFVAHDYMMSDQVCAKSEQVCATGASQWHHMTLTDGTVVHVDARSRVEVEYTDEVRIVHVYEGGAVFEVAKNSKRPFIARTHLVDVTAVGTRFGVSIDSGVTATVSEGVVNVTGRGRVDGKTVMLRAGEELRVSDSSLSSPHLAHVDAESKLQWATGYLFLRRMTVAEGVEELNRRNRVQIVVESPILGGKVLSFVMVRVDAPETYARFVAAQPGVRMIVDKENSVIRLSE